MTNWSKIPFDILSVIGRYLDGRAVGACQHTCKNWKRIINMSTDLYFKMRTHYVNLEHIEELKLLVSSGQIKEIRVGTFNKWLMNIMWFNHGYNTMKYNIDMDNLNELAQNGEGRRYYLDVETGDLVFMTNFYGSFLRRCVIHDFTSNHAIYYKCTQSEHFTDFMCKLQSMFPNTFEWKHIRFPFTVGARFNVVKGDGGFHRGAAIYIRVKSGVVRENFSITSKLTSRARAEPDHSMSVGRGNKRRRVYTPIPPSREQDVKNLFIEYSSNNHDTHLSETHGNDAYNELSRLEKIRLVLKFMP